MMKTFWRWILVVVAQHCDYTLPLSCTFKSGSSAKFNVYGTAIKGKYQEEWNEIELKVCGNMSL